MESVKMPMNLLGHYTIARPRIPTGVLFNVSDGSDLEYRQLGEMEIALSVFQERLFWKVRPKKRRLRKKWLKYSKGRLVSMAWASYSQECEKWFVHPKMYDILLAMWHSTPGVTNILELTKRNLFSRYRYTVVSEQDKLEAHWAEERTDFPSADADKT
jgi:hypothetical protein